MCAICIKVSLLCQNDTEVILEGRKKWPGFCCIEGKIGVSSNLSNSSFAVFYLSKALTLSTIRDWPMGMLTINDLKAGMVLAQPAKNRHGTVILGEGNVLAEKHINSFKTWGITGVDIKGIDDDQVIKQEMETLPNHIVESIEKELDELFPPFEDNPVMEEIYKIVKKVSLRQAANQIKGATDEIGKD